MTNIILGGYRTDIGSGSIDPGTDVVGSPTFYAGGLNVDFAVGAFTGTAGLPSGPLNSMTAWMNGGLSPTPCRRRRRR